MYPRLFELGPVHRSTLRRAAGRGVSARPAARDGARAKRAGSTRTACSTSASTSSSARWSARSCCCSSPTSTRSRSNPAELLTLARSGGVFYGGLIARGRGRALVHPQHRPAAVDDVRRVRAGHRARPRRRPVRVLFRRLLLRQADERAVGDHVHQPVRGRRTSARRSNVPLHPTQLYEAGAELLILVVLLATERQGPAVPGPHVLALHAALRDLALHHRVLSRRSARHGAACSRRRSSSRCILAPLAIVMLVVPAAPDGAGAGASCRARAQGRVMRRPPAHDSLLGRARARRRRGSTTSSPRAAGPVAVAASSG